MKNATIYTQILKTGDYSQFKILKENRKINSRNYGQLVASMKEELLVIPILVNERMEIIDGQHRYTACKELKLPIYYYMVEGYDIDQVRRANMVGTNWTKDDYLNMYIEKGEDVYIEFKGLTERYGITINSLLKLFSKIQKKAQNLMGKEFEAGIIELKGMDTAIDFLMALNDFDFFEHYQSVSFITAFVDLYFHPDYSHQTMKDRLIKRQTAFEKQGSAGDYLSMLTRDIYSFGAVKKPLFYDAETSRFYS